MSAPKPGSWIKAKTLPQRVTPKPSQTVAVTPLYSTSSGGESIDNRSTKDSSLPTDEELLFWYKCYRKVAFHSKEDATASVMENNPERAEEFASYACLYCRNLHIGKTGKTQNWTDSTSRSMIRAQWKKRKNKPEIAELADMYNNPTKRKRFWKENN